MSDVAEQQSYDRIQDVPTKLLATRFVCGLIMAKGNVGKWQAVTELLIRELRGEPLGDEQTADKAEKPLVSADGKLYCKRCDEYYTTTNRDDRCPYCQR